MKISNIPGFAAEASLFTTRPYGLPVTFGASQCRSQLFPQLGRPTGPYGPIGLPGQDCYGACMHVCMSFGRFSDRCMTDCLSTCSQPSFSTSVAFRS